MKLKTVEVEGETYAAINDGKPVYVSDDGEETTYDPVAMHQTIGRLNNEAKSHREAKESLEEQVKAFEDIDPEKAREAMETVQKLDQKKLVDAGEIDRVKAEVAKPYEKKLQEAEEAREGAESELARLAVDNAFSGSKYAKDKLAMPEDMLKSYFGGHFKYDRKSRKITPVNKDGDPIYSDSNPGEVAGFDEALEKLVSAYPHKDQIMKGSGNSGSGAGPVGQGGKRVYSRDEFNNLSAQDKHKVSAAVREGKAELTD